MRLLSLGLHVLDEVDDAVGVAHLVVVPGDQLDEGGGDLDSGLGVKDRGAGVAEEVGGHHAVLGVAEHSLEGSLRGSPSGEKREKLDDSQCDSGARVLFELFVSSGKRVALT